MSLTTFERAVIAEASVIIGRKLRRKDLMEWCTSPIKAQPGEFLVYCKDIGVYASFKGPI